MTDVKVTSGCIAPTSAEASASCVRRGSGALRQLDFDGYFSRGTSNGIDAEFVQRVRIYRVVHTLGVDVDRDAVQHRDDAADERGAAGVRSHADRHRAVQLDEIQARVEQSIDLRQAIARVFQAEPYTTRPQLP